ncbi:BRO-N domain-containing protein [Nocardia asiatica]|uniref:BRO-N domain-containing protein n=1 Tax=Nocardia asiatica TaxID=209252 RepID=UPI002456857F|nr:Bro-N domain-containing protein [Nocardia asiatica]
MSTEVMPFTYEGSEVVRTLVIDGDPWFVLSDLCRVLDIANGRNVAARLADDQKGVRLVDTPGGRQQMTIVNESGMYEVVIRSDKPEAVAFRRWITGEVLPTIRKTGGAYIAPGSQAELDLSNPDTALDKLIEVAQVAKAERARRLALQEQIEAERPMVERAKNHASGSGLKTRQQFFREVKQWAQDQHGVTVKQDHVMTFLSTKKLGLFARGNRADSGQATAWAIEKGYAVNKEDTTETGRNVVTGKLTARGQDYAWERIFRYIDANGTLELPRQIGGAA